jgi:hypothetical protein
MYDQGKKGHSARPRHSKVAPCLTVTESRLRALALDLCTTPKIYGEGVGFPNLYCHVVIIVREEMVET